MYAQTARKAPQKLRVRSPMGPCRPGGRDVESVKHGGCVSCLVIVVKVVGMTQDSSMKRLGKTPTEVMILLLIKVLFMIQFHIHHVDDDNDNHLASI
ncbi:Uncharacterized protein HZ326_11180 [Fusarium oxysporum f. sp. albedinis]|nr:Uncharacterized protein HZ326_11180 [Fusarium oxysporum f. sp. albedinis]